MHMFDSADLGDLAILGDHDCDQHHPSPTPDDTCILLNPSYSHLLDSAADSDEPEPANLKSDIESDSGWNSDLDSDLDAPRPVPAVRLTTTQQGRLVFQNRLIHWKPSVLDNYIKFRVYFKHWRKGYTYLVAENLLNLLSPLAYPLALQAFLHTRHLENFHSDLLLLHQINTKMGEVHHTFWWKSFSDKQKQARTEEEAKLINEKFGSHNGLSEEMKARIAAKVNEGKISYGQWKKLTKPTSGETYDPSVFDTCEAEPTEPFTDEIQEPSVLTSPVVDLATEELTGLDIPQSGAIEKQRKYQRRKGRRHVIKTADKCDNVGIVFTESKNPSKLTLIKQTADESGDKIIDNDRTGNAVICERKNEKSEEIEQAMFISLSQGNQGSSSTGVVDKDEGSGKTPIHTPAYGDTDTTLIVSCWDTTQTGLNSDIKLDKEKENGKALARYSGHVKTNENMDVPSEILTHNNQPSDVRLDKAEGETLGKNLQTQKNIQIIDLTSNCTAQGEESSGNTQNEENGRSTDATAEKKNPLDSAFNEEGKNASDALSPDAENLDNTLADEKGAPSNSVTPPNLKPQDIFIDTEQKLISNKVPAQGTISSHFTLDEGEKASLSNAAAQKIKTLTVTPNEEHEASSSMATAQNDIALNLPPTNKIETLPGSATVQDPIRLSITLDAETGKLSITAQRDRQNGQSADVASNQNISPLDMTLDLGTGERSMKALLDGHISQTIDITDNQSMEITGNQDTQPVTTMLGTRNQKPPISALSSEEMTQGIDTVIESPNSTQHNSQPPSHNRKDNISVTNLAVKTDASGDFTRKVAIPKKEHLDLLHNKVKVSEKGKAPSGSLSDERIDQNIDITSANPKLPSDMTLQMENKGKALIQDLSDSMINPGVEAANRTHNQTVYPSASSSNDLKEMILGKDQTDEPDPSINAAGKIIAQRKQTSESVIDEGKGKEPAKTASNNALNQHTSATSNPKAKAVHFNETWGINQEGEPQIEYLADRTMAASKNATSKEMTDKGLDFKAPADHSPEKAQSSNSTLDKTEQNSESAYPSTNHHQPDPLPSRPPLVRVRGATGLKWAYFTHTIADEALLASGLWLFEKPTTYFEYQPYHYVRRGLGLIQAPIAVATYEEDDEHEPYEPSVDIDNLGVWINTHEEPWRDVRSKPTHPDFQPTSKLLEYQACESLGIAVWRHDRNLLNCRLPECKVKIADHNPSTKICLGCGPKTITRYCSEAHQIADLEEHWKECGQPEFLMKRVIDATTSPARFGRLWPAIRDRSGNSSYERSRQATYAAMQRGRYTLFDPETEAPTTLVWPMEDEQAAMMEDRVERLLNYALLDHKHGRITGLLYRMIRQCLIQKNFWAIGPIHAVKTQFVAEFGCDVSKSAEQPLCECEWVGARLPRDRHVAGCKRLYLAYSAEYQATGIQGFLEMMEGRFWALRAWRQRHPTVKDWEARVSGSGFVGEVDGVVPFLGPGWSGWGSPADDLID